MRGLHEFVSADKINAVSLAQNHPQTLIENAASTATLSEMYDINLRNTFGSNNGHNVQVTSKPSEKAPSAQAPNSIFDNCIRKNQAKSFWNRVSTATWVGECAPSSD